MFVKWLDREIQQRGLTDADLAKRGGFGQAVISKARSGVVPGWDACVGIAKALGLPAEFVFRQAGHLPPLPGLDTVKVEMDQLWSLASLEQRQQVLEFLRFLVERKRIDK